MTLSARLTAAGLELPDYEGRDLGAVLSGALAAVGGANIVTARDGEADRVRLGIPHSRHVIVVLVDGLGALQLEDRRGHAPVMRSIAHGEVMAGYPTTTAASLAFLGTGRPAGTTGMAGYTVRNPRTGTLANLVSWEGADDAATWQPCASLLETAAAAGVSVTTIGSKRFEGSGLTRAVLHGGAFVGVESLDERVDAALAAARVPGVTYLYWGEVDKAGHRWGWQSDAWVAAVEETDRGLGRLSRSLPRGATLVVTADHGMVDVADAPRWDVAQQPGLSEGVDMIAGEPRALHVYARGEVSAEQIAARWTDVLGEHAVVGTRDEARQARLFGDLAPAMQPRIGDVVVAMTGISIVVDSRTQSPESISLPGMHGSLTPGEVRVPLLLATRA